MHHEQGQEDRAPRLAVGAATGGASPVRAGEEGHLFEQSGFYLSRGEPALTHTHTHTQTLSPPPPYPNMNAGRGYIMANVFFLSCIQQVA